MDDYRNEPIADRIGRDFTGAMSLYILLLGHRLGLLRALAERGPLTVCLLYTSPSPRDRTRSRMPSSA